MSDLAKIILQAKPGTSDNDAAAVAGRIRDAANAVMQLMAERHLELKLKSKVWLQLREQLAATIAEAALIKVVPILKSIKKRDYR